MAIGIRSGRSIAAYRIAALVFLILASGLTAMLSPVLLLIAQVATDAYPVVTWAIFGAYFVLPVFGWHLLLLGRPIAALFAGVPALLLGLAGLVAWLVVF